MTHNEFYRIAVADPDCQAPDFLAAVACDPQLAAQVSEAKQFNDQLGMIFEPPQPSDSLTNKLLNISLTERSQPQEPVTSPVNKPAKFAVNLAIAASFAVAAVSFGLLQNHNFTNPDLSSHAMAHSAHGASFAGVIDERPSISSVNYRLASLGAKFSDNLTDLTWFNGCSFDGVNSLHLVFAGKMGPINVFIVPKNGAFDFEAQYSNDTYQGIAQEYPAAYVMIVGLKDEPLQPFQQKIDHAIHWNI